MQPDTTTFASLGLLVVALALIVGTLLANPAFTVTLMVLLALGNLAVVMVLTVTDRL